MKKILMKFADEVLSKNEMKFIIGGASVTANCGGGVTVTCSGHTNCEATDNVGCICWDANGSSKFDCPAE